MFKNGLHLFDNWVSKDDLLSRLRKMKPNIDLPDFDYSKEDDSFYCVEWGIKKGKWMEEGVLDRLIDDIKNNKKLS